jgi:ATP-dependent DNA helicase RecG
MFLARYIEKFGTGTVMMIRECSESNLPEPVFEQRGGEFVVTLWRDWLTDQVVAELALNDRQMRAIRYLKTHTRITNSGYQESTGASRATASRELDALLAKGVLEKVGKTGRSTHYVLAKKRLTKASKDSRS